MKKPCRPAYLPFNSLSFPRKNAPCRVGSNCQFSISWGDQSGSKTHAVHEMPRSSKKSMIASPYVSSAITGSDAVSQYFPEVRDLFANRATVPDEYLLWFHRVRWDERMRSGRTLWEELVYRYNEGVEQVRGMQRVWDSMEGRIDEERVCPEGGALALGHPWGASGAVLAVRLFTQLVRHGRGETGLAAIAVGGGQGVAMVVRRCP